MTKKKAPLTGLLCLALATSGFTFTSISPLLQALAGHYANDVSTAGLLISANSLGFVLFTFLYGLWGGKAKPRHILVAALVLLGFGCHLLALSTSFVHASVVMVAMGGCMGLVQSLALSAGSQHSRLGNRFSYVGMMFYGVGALLGPLGASLLLQWGVGWQVCFQAAGCLLLLEGCLLLPLRFGQSKQEKGQHSHAFLPMPPNNRPFLLLCLAMALYCGGEVGSWGLLSSYLSTERGFSVVQSGIAVAVFWSGIIVGRATAGWLHRRLSEKTTVQWFPVLSAAIGLLAFFPTEKGLIYLFVGLLGFFLADIWPSIASIGGDFAKGNNGGAYALLIAAGGIGSVLGPILQGMIASSYGMTAAMLQPVALLVGVAIVMRYPLQKEIGGM